MLSESLIQFSVDGRGCVPSLILDLRPNFPGGNEDNIGPPSKGLMQAVMRSVPQPAAGHRDPRLCWRFLDTLRQVWVSLLWGHCAFLLGPGVHKVSVEPSKSLFLQFCGSAVIKAHWPPKSNSLGVLSTFARSPGWGICYGSWWWFSCSVLSSQGL